MAKLKKISPNFSVKDVRETVGFYQNVLGFNLIMAVRETQDGVDEQLVDGEEYVYAMLVKDDVEFMFQRKDTLTEELPFFESEKEIGATVSFYMDIEGIEEFYNELKTQNIPITELKTTWYGMREFYIKDNNGYVLGFAELSEQSAK